MGSLYRRWDDYYTHPDRGKFVVSGITLRCRRKTLRFSYKGTPGVKQARVFTRLAGHVGGEFLDREIFNLGAFGLLPLPERGESNRGGGGELQAQGQDGRASRPKHVHYRLMEKNVQLKLKRVVVRKGQRKNFNE